MGAKGAVEILYRNDDDLPARELVSEWKQTFLVEVD